MKKYFGDYLRNLKGTLQRYSYLLLLAIEHLKIPLEEYTILDYGGVSGIFSLLAKEVGIGQVIYNDIIVLICLFK